MSTISRNEWIFEQCSNILNDKEKMVRDEILQMLNRSTKMFKYKNLPDTIYYKDFETQLQVGGFSVFNVYKDNLYCFNAGLGGEPSPYYLPTKAIIANPALRYNATLDIDKNCVVALNDHYYQGMMPMFNKYARLLVEAEISLKFAFINARVPALISADNDDSYKSAEAFFDKITKGEKYGIIASTEMLDGVKSHDFFKQHYIKEIIEGIQYIRGSWYNSIGLNAAFNMKREAINEAEANLNEDILYPSIDTMLECRQIAVDKTNRMYGTNISVELDSIWGINRKIDDVSMEKEVTEIEVMKEDGNETV